MLAVRRDHSAEQRSSVVKAVRIINELLDAHGELNCFFKATGLRTCLRGFGDLPSLLQLDLHLGETGFDDRCN